MVPPAMSSCTQLRLACRVLWPSISHSSSSWVSTDAAASQTHWSLLPTNSTAAPNSASSLAKSNSLVIKVQVTASMLPSPVPVLSSSTQSLLHWVGANVGLDEDGDTDGAAVGCDNVGPIVGLADAVGGTVGDCVGEHVAAQHDVLHTAATLDTPQKSRNSEQSEFTAPSPATPMSGYIGSPVHRQMLLGDSDG